MFNFVQRSMGNSGAKSGQDQPFRELVWKAVRSAGRVTVPSKTALKIDACGNHKPRNREEEPVFGLSARKRRLLETVGTIYERRT